MLQSSPTASGLHRSIDLSAYYHALGDPLRCAIIELLCEQPMNVQTLNERLERYCQKRVAQETVSSALQLLRDHGLVSYRQRWRNREYSANKFLLDQITSVTQIRFRLDSQQSGNC